MSEYAPILGSPIIIDFGGGYKLSLLKDGVPFDFYGTGQPVQVSWPEEGSGNGFLVLPDKEGMVPSAKYMFGNLTPQDKSSDPNGFLALAEYDEPDKQGNGDGVIDSRDAIWNDLRIWIDANHDGISQPGELYTLDTLGIESISLKYTHSPYIDLNGKAFRYKGSMIFDPTRQKDRRLTIYDVILQIGPIR